MITTSPMFVFDLDGTLAESKQAIPNAIAEMLTDLSKKFRVAILTGGTINQIKSQVLDFLPKPTPISVYACSGTTYQLPNSDLVSLPIPVLDREYLKTTLKQIVTAQGYWCETPNGEIIEDRISQVTFSALGQNAYPEHKKLWDSDGRKRQAIITALKPHLGNYVAFAGGSTSIDITHNGHTKQQGIQLIARHHDINTQEIIFIGDDLEPGGNDYPVKLTDASCYATRNWLHTIQIVKDLTFEVP